MAYDDVVLSYRTSKDYERLLVLLGDRQEIVCFVDYEKTCRDVCSARCFADDDYIRISARGIQYNNPLVRLGEKEKFTTDCKRMNLEFIDPFMEDS